MKFEELDARMRIFETSDDHCILPELFIVVRLDGRGFTRLTKETWQLAAPFDVRFKEVMQATTEHVFSCGFSALYGYTQSDEISLLLRRDDGVFGRKTRKILSVLAGEASAKFTHQMGQLACFDARISQLPTAQLVRDYFVWRQEDAHRNALNAHCYWSLRHGGSSARAATQALKGLSVAEKNELLFQTGVNFNDLPSWQKRGCGVYWENYDKPAHNPTTGAAVLASRRRIRQNSELPFGAPYGEFITAIVENAGAEA